MKLKKTLFTLIAIGLLSSGIQYSLASFTDADQINNNKINTGIWNPGKLTVTEVLYDPTGADLGKEWIRIRNTGGFNINTLGYVLHFNGVGTNHFVFPDMLLTPDKEVTVHVRTEGTNTGTDLYWPNTGNQNMNNNSGSISLFKALPKNASNMVDFMQYGAISQNNEGMAGTTGIWTIGAFVADADEGNSLKLIDNIDNNLVSDWRS